jgi:hypothetical protein
MNRKFPICFEIYLKSNISKSRGISHQLFDYEFLLQSLNQVCGNFVFSLRYFYEPSSDKKLKSFILINSLSNINNEDIWATVFGLITKGSLSRFYSFNYIQDGFPGLDCISSIGELIKYGEFIEQPDFFGYLPHFFETNLNRDNFSLVDFLDGARYENVVLEFSLKSYNSPTEQAYWSSAIEDLVERLSNSGTRNSSTTSALNLYRKYQDSYSKNQLFNYSIKALGKNTGDTFTLLQTFLEVANKNISKKNNPIISLNRGDSRFLKSLQATQTVNLFNEIEWEGWQRELGKKLEKKLIKETVTSGGLLSNFDDGSLNFPILPSSSSNYYHLRLNSSNNNTSADNPNKENLVLGENSPFSRLFEPQIPKVEHLKPLHRITTYQEVIGFFQLFSTSISSSSMQFTALSAEKIFNKYRHLINEDTYIVGLDDDGNPVTSSWAEIPHRLIAGVTQAGKTNFLHWVIFQFLYVNPRRKVYIADFKGTDFVYFEKLGLSVEIIDSPEDCQNLVEKIHQEEYERRRKLMKSYEVSNLCLLQKEGVDIDRTLWVIDEAADIADLSSKLRDSIEKRLKEYARKGRTFGLHVLYCTQRPTTEVVTKQVTDQCEEKIVFRVTPDASQRILDDTIAGDIPKNARGRAWLDGYAVKKFVNVPKMEKPEGTTIPISDTLWHHFTSR